MKLFLKIILTVLVFLGTTRGHSQDFEVAPVKLSYNIGAGETDTKVLTVRNHANKLTKFSLQFVDFIVDNEGRTQEMRRNSTKNSCTEWLQPEQTVFEVKPGEAVDIKIKMIAPAEDIAARWAMMYVQTLPDQTAYSADKSTRTGINLMGRIAVMIYRTAGSQGVLKADISNITEKITSDNTRRIFTAQINNTGNAIATCKVTFIANNLATAEEVKFDPITLDLLPGFSRQVEFTMPDNVPPGEYSLIALLDFGSKTTIEGTRYNKKVVITK